MVLSATNGFQVATEEREDSQQKQTALLSWVFPVIWLEMPTGPSAIPIDGAKKQSCLPTKAQRNHRHQGSSSQQMRRLLECLAQELQVQSYLVSYEKESI